MIISDKQLRKLSRYKSSSFAIWSETFPSAGCQERKPKNQDLVYKIIYDEKANLKPNVILTGLNRSQKNKTGIYWRFRNFHRPTTRKKNGKRNQSNDFILKKFIQDCNLNELIGSYMTDLSDEIEEKESRKVIVEQSDILKFIKQIKILNQKLFHIVSFGDDAFNRLMEFNAFKINEIKTFYPKIILADISFKEIDIKLYRLWHYANFKKWDELKKQLRKINKIIAN